MSIMAKTPSGYKKIGSAYLGERPVDKVFNANGGVVYALQRELTGVPPLLFKGKEQSELLNYRIYGDTIDGESVGDRTGNLFEAELVNYNVNADGKIYTLTDFILSIAPVIAGATYTISNNQSANAYAFYQQYPKPESYSYNSSRYVFNENSITIVAPIDGYIVVRKAASDPPIMLNEGSTPLPYEPYGYKVPVTVEGKNLFDGELTDSYHLSDTTGLPISFVRRFATLQPITINQSEYCLTYNSTTDLRFMYSVFNNDTLIRRVAMVNNRYLQSGDAIDTTGGNKIYFAFYNNDYSHASTEMISNIMLNSGSTALPYEPYHAPVTTPIYLPEPIKMVGDEAEYIDYGEQKLHRVRKNLLQNTVTSQTINGVTFTVNTDGSITCSGILTSGEYADLVISGVFLGNTDILENGNYIVSCANASNNASLLVGNSEGEVGRVRNAEISISANLTWAMLRIRQADPAITLYPMIRKADVEDDTYEPYIENTDLDVTLPALPTIKGTNAMSIGTTVQPSRMDIKGRIKSLS